jgi:hypothetical protein
VQTQVAEEDHEPPSTPYPSPTNRGNYRVCEHSTFSRVTNEANRLLYTSDCAFGSEQYRLSRD